MENLTLKIVFMIFWFTTFAIRFPFAMRNKKNKIVQDDKTTVEKLTLAGTFFGMILFPLLYVFTPLLTFADYQVPFYGQAIGILLAPPTLWLFYRSHKDLGRNWSATLEIREGHFIVDKGVYKYIRHPMYTSIWLWGIIQALLLQNYLAGLGGIISFGILYFLRVAKEEAMMSTQFGQLYEDYKKRTKRIIPFLV